jgi:BirA family biotin operon repressor/biotin-[acetyl-CoA-carboxylase] ligase
MMTLDHGWVVHHYDSLGSTMDQAALLARLGAKERTAVVSDVQTAGRGRAGRTWHAPPGTALLCTLILRPPIVPTRLSVLPLVIGVAVAEAIESVTGQRARLKWPNDVWLGSDPDNRKVAGILVASHLSGTVVDYALAGIGINVATRQEDLPPGATSLNIVSGLDIDPPALLELLLERFDTDYAAFVAAEGRPSLDPWRARAAMLGELVTVVENDCDYTGTFLGIDDDGALLLAEPSQAIRRIVAGDLSRGPCVRESPLSRLDGRGGWG